MGLLVTLERSSELCELNVSEPVETPVALEKPDSVDKGDVVAWLDSIDEPNGVDDTTV